jgi:hypothetical protein
MKRTTIIPILFLSLLLAACSAADEIEAKYVATMASLGTPPPPEYQTLAAVYLGLTLTPTPRPIQYGTPTMSVYDFSLTQVAYQQSLSLTEQANGLQLEREKLQAEQAKLQAEQRAEENNATAAAAQRTAEAVDAQRTAYAQATNAQGTAYAQATSTQVALGFIQETAAAHAVETQQASQLTAVVEPTHAVWTQQAVWIEQTVSAGEADKVRLAVERQEKKNMLDAYGPWALVVFVIVVSSEGFRKWLKTRVFKRDEHGKLPVVQTETDDGKKVLTKLDLMKVPALEISKDGKVEEMKSDNPAEQSDVTRRTQAIEAISFLPTPYAQQGTKMMNAEFGNRNGAPQVLVRNNPAMNPVLDEADGQFLEEQQ